MNQAQQTAQTKVTSRQVRRSPRQCYAAPVWRTVVIAGMPSSTVGSLHTPDVVIAKAKTSKVVVPQSSLMSDHASDVVRSSSDQDESR